MKRPLRLLTGLLLVLVTAAIAVPLATHLTPGVLAAIDPPPPVEPPVTPALQIPPTSVAVPDVVTPLSPSAPAPDPAVLGPALEAALQIPGPGTFAGTVIDPADGTVLYAKEAGRLQAPASTIELFTAVASMVFGQPEKMLTTSVLAADTTPGALYLRGGGDVLLGSGRSDPDVVVGRAGLGTLAAETATALFKGPGPYTERGHRTHGACGHVRRPTPRVLLPGRRARRRHRRGEVRRGRGGRRPRRLRLPVARIHRQGLLPPHPWEPPSAGCDRIDACPGTSPQHPARSWSTGISRPRPQPL